MTTEQIDQIDAVAKILSQSKSILCITGAGLSANSGLPTYRGTGGLYSGSSGDGPAMEELLTTAGLTTSPEKIWQHFSIIEQSCRQAEPNRGHQVIAQMEPCFERFWVLTQNIDSLHGKAGSQNVIAIHGDIHQIRCTACTHHQSVDDYSTFEQEEPRCPACGAWLRPDVVLFGEELPRRQLDLYSKEIDAGFDVILSIGTSSQFDYIYNPVLDAELFDRLTVEINPQRTQISDCVSVRIEMEAAACLEEIWQRFLVYAAPHSRSTLSSSIRQR